MTTTTPPVACALGEATGILDDAIGLARLAPGGVWSTDSTGVAFDDRTNPAEEFAARLAFDCAARVAQRLPGGDERLALIAWNDVRHAYVIQATDGPSAPYLRDIRFQLFVDQPLGEWLEERFVWAGTLSGGESMIVGTRDYSAAITAKSWQSFVPRFEDIPVTLESEQHGIDVLRAAGARNVSVAEPASVGYPIGSIQLYTPRSLVAFAVVGPVDFLDPMVPLVPAESTFHTIEGVEVRLGIPTQPAFEVAEIGWRCGEHSWRLYTDLGTPEELLAFTGEVIRADTC